MLANGRAFLLLGAGLTVTRACRKRNGVLVGNKDSTSLPGLPAMLNPSPAAGRMCPVRPQRQPVPGRRHQPVSPGWCSRGTPGNADGIYPGFTCSLSEKSAVLFSDGQCG